MDIPLPTRPMRPDDLERLHRLWPRLSGETIYRRFHSAVRCLPPELVHRLVDVDHDQREAVVAVVGDDIVGVARYDRSPDDRSSADFAVLVEDAWQGVGVGRQLIAEVTALAAGRGVRTVTALVQTDNDRMVGLLHGLLPGLRFTPEASVYAVTGPIEPRRHAGTTTAAPALADAGSRDGGEQR